MDKKKYEFQRLLVSWLEYFGLSNGNIASILIEVNSKEKIISMINWLMENINNKPSIIEINKQAKNIIGSI